MIVTVVFVLLGLAFLGCLFWMGAAMDAIDRDVQRLLREMREDAQ